MLSRSINKIIYFDKETIQNILQEQNSGELRSKYECYSESKKKGNLSAEAMAKIKLDVPFISRLLFLVSGKLEASFIRKIDSTTTISSTEVSEFKELKESLTKLEDIQLTDIENSSTFLRVAGGYLKMIKGDIDDIDAKEFKNVMDSYDGYDTYKVSQNVYVRFNNKAFVSNYKRNDLLTTTMNLYCVPVGRFRKERFDFIREIERMESLISSTESTRTLADVYPPKDDVKNYDSRCANDKSQEEVTLYDVLYACVTLEN